MAPPGTLGVLRAASVTHCIGIDLWTKTAVVTALGTSPTSWSLDASQILTLGQHCNPESGKIVIVQGCL